MGTKTYANLEKQNTARGGWSERGCARETKKGVTRRDVASGERARVGNSGKERISSNSSGR